MGETSLPLGPSINRRPEIRTVTVTPAVVVLGGTATIRVDAIDPDGDRLFFRYSAQAGSVIPDPADSSRATYVQNGTDRPSDRLAVTVTDTKNASTTMTRSIGLQGNRPPEVEVNGGGGCHPRCSKNFSADASDADGDSLSYVWTGCASGTGRSASCQVDGVGTFTATVVVSDGKGGVTTASGFAEGTNAPPVVSGGMTFHSARARFNVSYGDSDDDASSLVCGWIGDCQCTGSNQSFNLDCVLPSTASSCFERFSCTDPFGASDSTEFFLAP